MKSLEDFQPTTYSELKSWEKQFNCGYGSGGTGTNRKLKKNLEDLKQKLGNPTITGATVFDPHTREISQFPSVSIQPIGPITISFSDEYIDQLWAQLKPKILGLLNEE